MFRFPFFDDSAVALVGSAAMDGRFRGYFNGETSIHPFVARRGDHG
jgi:hypothetical protein